MMTKDQHEKEVRHILKELNCMDRKGQIRRWTDEAAKTLRKHGHTSLSSMKCACCGGKA